jgi:hypothetical protein
VDLHLSFRRQTILIRSKAKDFWMPLERFARRYNPHVARRLRELHLTPEEILASARDRTKGKNDVCPIHHVRMAARTVPIIPGSDARYDYSLGPIAQKKFPFAREVISLNYSVDDDPRNPTTGKIFVCPECVAGLRPLHCVENGEGSAAVNGVALNHRGQAHRFAPRFDPDRQGGRCSSGGE